MDHKERVTVREDGTLAGIVEMKAKVSFNEDARKAGRTYEYTLVLILDGVRAEDAIITGANQKRIDRANALRKSFETEEEFESFMNENPRQRVHWNSAGTKIEGPITPEKAKRQLDQLLATMTPEDAKAFLETLTNGAGS